MHFMVVYILKLNDIYSPPGRGFESAELINTGLSGFMTIKSILLHLHSPSYSIFTNFFQTGTVPHLWQRGNLFRLQ